MILHNIQPEQQFCLILARRNLSPELAHRARLLVRKGLDWDGVWDSSVRHRIFPLVFRHLERFEPGLVPPRIMRLFYILSVANSKKSDMLAKELARIVKTFGKAGIPVVPFKGPLLGNLVWGDHRLWSGVDLDLLVRYPDMRRAYDLLHEEGYRPIYGSDDVRRPKRFFLGRGKPMTATLAKEDANITMYVDLHESLFPWSVGRRGLDEQVWEDVRPGDIFGASGFVLPRLWNVILLSLHAAKHLFVLLRWAAELHQLWDDAKTDQSMILEKSEQLGLTKTVLLSVAVCERLLGDGSEVTSSPHVDNALVTRLSRNVFRQSLSPISTALLQLRLPGSIIGKVNRLATSLFLPTIIEKDLLPLPQPFHFLYYGIRPIRLVLKHGLGQRMVTRKTGTP
ncbi:MAG: nucleotidyltransferase family protein [bacterium]|nr:nucleotidyltransferase family protein [bacterium]